ncbi:hypothetical protein Ami103574_02590 [Aminipila butyrica]|uniref:Bacteriophage Gp15 protein n=1 Tax=Aminipila butyrica TaxID=433296 RepID=A0A858BRS7_9FIRM|nr:Gp15 family bacteriophage protein [Aminipila butyrica]QIB68267.1 hypothetical protein Ami103574_02590 [Aminipila butyrica]
MISKLPKTLTVAGVEYEIHSDFRPCFNIMQIFERNDLTEPEKLVAMAGVLYDKAPFDYIEEAIVKALWFLDGGDAKHTKKGADYGKLYSWEQDEQFILSAVNLTLGISCRGAEYLHWWDFMAALMDCKECTFTTLIHQRKLKKQGKQQKWDKEWWAENKNIVELDKKSVLTSEEQAQLDKFNSLLG